MIPSPVRRLAFHALHALRPGDRLIEEIARFRRGEFAPPAENQRLLETRLATLLDHCAAHVPYYRERMTKTRAGSPLEQLRELPLLDKAAIRARSADFLAENLPRQRRIANDTSGSTGSVLRFHLDADSRDPRAAFTQRFYSWCGLRATDTHAMLWGAPFDAPAAAGTTARLKASLQPLLFLSSYDVGDATLDEYIRKLRRFGPRLLTSYASPLTQLADRLATTRTRIESLRAVICSAEQLFPAQRKRIEAALRVPVFDRYGSREFGNVAQECDRHDGLHVGPGRLVLEIVNGAGRPLPAGEEGEIAITDLDNFAHPFVRYRTGDLARWMDGDCSCGRTLPRISSIQGRTMDMVVTPQGRRIAGTFWTLMVRKVSPRIVDFQVVQKRPDLVRILLRMEGSSRLTDDEENRLRQWMREHAPELRWEADGGAEFVRTRAGKRRVVVNESQEGR